MKDHEYHQASAQEAAPQPREFDPPGAEFVPPPQEFAQPALKSGAGSRRTSLHRLLIFSLAAVLTVSASLAASADRTETPVHDVIEQIETIMPALPTIADVPTEPIENVTEPADLYEGMTDAEVLVAHSPWQAADISCTFLENGTGYWTTAVRFGRMTWTETEDGHVAYEGSAVLFNADISDNSSSSGSGDLSDEQLDEIYYAEVSACSGIVELDRMDGTAALDSPLGSKNRIYTPGDGQIDARFAALSAISPDTLRCGEWLPADDIADGVRSLSFDADGTAIVSVYGKTLTCQADFSGSRGAAWIHIFNTEEGNFHAEIDSSSWIDFSGGLQMIIGIRGGEPILTFFDASADTGFSFRVFTRPDLDSLLGSVSGSEAANE